MTDRDLLAQPITLGLDETDAPIQIPIESFMRSTYIAGLQGTGKSNLLKHLFREIVQTGCGAMLIDPHGDVSQQLLESLPPEIDDRLVYLDAADKEYAFGLNLFRLPGEGE